MLKSTAQQGPAGMQVKMLLHSKRRRERSQPLPGSYSGASPTKVGKNLSPRSNMLQRGGGFCQADWSENALDRRFQRGVPVSMEFSDALKAVHFSERDVHAYGSLLLSERE